MTNRSTSWLIAAALAAAAAPALAQDGRYDPGPPPPLPEEGAWDEDWQEYPDDEAYDDEQRGWEERERHSDAHDARPGEWREHPMPPHGPGQIMAFPPEQRAAWLEQCRGGYRGDREYGRGRERGQVIGGVLGAVAGGMAGREIADADDNLAGTLIGAGVGGLAGAAVGGAIGAEADRDRFEECEAYVVRYEESLRGYGRAYGPGPGAVGYHYPYPYPVMWVKVPIITERPGCGCETVVEERVVEEAPPPPRRRVVRDKRIRLTK